MSVPRETSDDQALQIGMPRKLIPVFAGPARFRCAYGGRGSGKTFNFAKMAAVRARIAALNDESGLILCCREFQNTLESSSLAEVKRAIRSDPWLEQGFEVGEKYIRTKCGRISFAFEGLRHNFGEIKGMSDIKICWVDEAEPVTDAAWQELIPTVRAPGSEIWVTWNPKRKGSATDMRFRNNADADCKVVELNWRDNPLFPDVLKKERLRDQRDRPDQYAHVWEGAYLQVQIGAYYAKHLADARTEGRIGRVKADPLMQLRAFWDIGGTGARADACSIWIAQFVGREIRVLDYYEAQGQPLATHVNWLRASGYGSALCVLPHDGVQGDKVYQVSYESSLRGAGFQVQVVKNQGAGAAKARIETARRLFPSIWIDEERCSGGLDALGWYHEKRDDVRGIGLGPDHDWSSHAADAFGLMCISYEAPAPNRPRERAPAYLVPAAWMAS